MSGFQPSKQGMDIDPPPLREGAEIYRAYSPASVEVFNCRLTAVTALKGHINSAQCGAERWGNRLPPRRRAESLNEY